MKNIVQKPKQTMSAFTLIELLVVIAIIAILAAILFPVFAQVREKARQTTCVSNKKQVVMGLLQYVQDNDENIPADGAGLRNPVTDDHDWQDSIYPYVKSEAAFDCPDNPYSSNNHDADFNYIADFNKAHYIYYKNLKAPSDTNYGSDSITLGYSDSINVLYGTPTGHLKTHAPCYMPGATNDWGCINTIAGIEAPASTAWFTDGIYMENPQWCALCQLPTRVGNTALDLFAAGFHHQKFVIAYCDGHVASIGEAQLDKLSTTGNNTFAIYTTEDD